MTVPNEVALRSREKAFEGYQCHTIVFINSLLTGLGIASLAQELGEEEQTVLDCANDRVQLAGARSSIHLSKYLER